MSRWEVTLEPHEVEECRRAAGLIDEAMGDPEGETYTGVNVAHGHFVGKCGEAAFRKWLEHHKVEYVEDCFASDPSEPDRYDFRLRLINDRLLNVDVKNSHHERALFLMIPWAQFKREEHHAYVGCTGEELGDGRARVIIHGIASRKTIKTHGLMRELKCLTIQFPLRSLAPLKDTLFRRRVAA